MSHEVASGGKEGLDKLCDLVMQDHPRTDAQQAPAPSAARPDGPAAKSGERERPVSLSRDQLNWLLPISPAKRPRTTPQSGDKPAAAPAVWADAAVARSRKLIDDNAENICLFAHAYETYDYDGRKFVSHNKTKDGNHELNFEFTVKGNRYTRQMQISFFFKKDGRFDSLAVNKSTTLYAPFKSVSKSYLKELRGQMSKGPGMESDAELLRSVDACDAQDLCEMHLKLVQLGRELRPAGPQGTPKSTSKVRDNREADKAWYRKFEPLLADRKRGRDSLSDLKWSKKHRTLVLPMICAAASKSARSLGWAARSIR